MHINRQLRIFRVRDPNFGAGLGQPGRVECNSMSQTIAAHFDGEHILLDEPVELEPNTKLLVTVLPKDSEREAWLALSKKRLAEAYANDEEEYPVDSIKGP